MYQYFLLITIVQIMSITIKNFSKYIKTVINIFWNDYIVFYQQSMWKDGHTITSTNTRTICTCSLTSFKRCSCYNGITC